jgi:hypothetical protein
MQIANKIYPIEIFSMLKKPAFYVIYSYCQYQHTDSDTSVWCQTHYDFNDKNYTISFESIDIQSH